MDWMVFWIAELYCIDFVVEVIERLIDAIIVGSCVVHLMLHVVKRSEERADLTLSQRVLLHTIVSIVIKVNWYFHYSRLIRIRFGCNLLDFSLVRWFILLGY